MAGSRSDFAVITHVYPVLEVTGANIIQQRGLIQVHQGAWEKNNLKKNKREGKKNQWKCLCKRAKVAWEASVTAAILIADIYKMDETHKYVTVYNNRGRESRVNGRYLFTPFFSSYVCGVGHVAFSRAVSRNFLSLPLLVKLREITRVSREYLQLSSTSLVYSPAGYTSSSGQVRCGYFGSRGTIRASPSTMSTNFPIMKPSSGSRTHTCWFSIPSSTLKQTIEMIHSAILHHCYFNFRHSRESALSRSFRII